MPEIITVCVVGVIMAALYSRTSRPKLYAFLNALAGAVSLIASELIFTGSLAGLTLYGSALSVILGVPGTIAHRFFQMIQG
ncbi:MAG: hypothetical protein IJU82_09320 [Ruminiclostridium sp.]|nr:hypothetical protein [Ruminiclostridium sp.]